MPVDKKRLIGQVIYYLLIVVGYMILNRYFVRKGAVWQRGNLMLSVEDKKILEEGERFVLYALLPMNQGGEMERDAKRSRTKSRKTFFQGYEVVSAKEIKDKSTRERMLEAVYSGIRGGDPSKQASCFEPHHALHAQLGNQSVDIVPCFDCRNVYVFVDGTRRDGAITEAPLDVLDEALLDAKMIVMPTP